MARQKENWPICAGVLKSGAPCQSVVARDEDGLPGAYCAHHLKTSAALSPPLAVEEGTKVPEQPAAAAPATAFPPALPDTAVAAGEPAPDEAEPGLTSEGPTESIPIASLRAALRGELSTSAVADLMGEMLLEALRASKEVFSTCPGCNRRHPVAIPDFGTRMKAAESLISEIEGRQAAVAKSSQERVHEALAGRTRIEDLTNDELLLLSLEENGSEWDLREDIYETAQRIVSSHDNYAGVS